MYRIQKYFNWGSKEDNSFAVHATFLAETSYKCPTYVLVVSYSSQAALSSIKSVGCLT